jgi:hypothetical protein
MKYRKFDNDLIFSDGETTWRICDVKHEHGFIMYYCVNDDIPNIERNFTGEAINDYLNRELNLN